MKYNKKVQKQIKKKLGVEDIDDFLTTFIEDTKKHSPKDHTQIKFLESLPDFLDSIAASYRQYDDKIKIAVRNVEISSKELNTANWKLENFNISLDAMLNSLDEGLFTFDESGICSDVFSASCIRLLEKTPSGMHIFDVLNIPEQEREELKSWMNLLFSNTSALDFEDLSSLAPEEYIHSQGRKIKLSYKPMLNYNGALQGVLVVVTDKTEEQETKRIIEEKERRALQILRINKNSNFFLQFLKHYEHFFTHKDPLKPEEESLVQLKNEIHTLKGLAGTFQFLSMMNLFHELETEIDHLKLCNRKNIQNLFIEYKEEALEYLDSAKQTALSILGKSYENKGKSLRISTTDIKDVMHEIEEKVTDDSGALLYFFKKKLLSTNLHDAFSIFDMELQEQANRVGKIISPCLFKGENVKILSDIYEPFLLSTIHIARNIPVHGIESPHLRKQLQKKLEGKVTIETATFDKDGKAWISICIRDDGGGIDTDLIKHKLISSGVNEDEISDMSKDDLVSCIFKPDFSTSNSIDTGSGRGIGMSAVAEEIKKLGGSIHIDTEIGRGTSFTIHLPHLWELPTNTSSHNV